MGHCVQAFVGKEETLNAICSKYGKSKVIPLKHGYSLLPLIEELYDTIAEVAEEYTYPSSNEFMFLSPKITKLLIDFSDHKGLTYFETDYFGGVGNQGAIAAREGKIIYGPSREKNSINKALRKIGVVRMLPDEYNKIGLGDFRSNEDWTQEAFMSDQEFCDALGLKKYLEQKICTTIRNESAKFFHYPAGRITIHSQTVSLNKRAWTPFISFDIVSGVENKLSELLGCKMNLGSVFNRMNSELPFSKRWFSRKKEAKTFGEWSLKLTKMISEHIAQTVDKKTIERCNF